MPKILAFAGSIRRDSWNRKLIRSAVDAIRAAGGDVTLIELAEYAVPHMNTGSDPVERANGTTIRPNAKSSRV